MGMDAPKVEKPSDIKRFAMKKVLLGLMGLAFLAGGVSLILRFWPDTAVVFRGVIGIFIAIAGLVMMTIARD